MTRLLAGAFSVVAVWVAYEVFRNLHGHRGGEAVALLCGEPVFRAEGDGRFARAWTCERPFGHDGDHAEVSANVAAVTGNGR